MDGFSGSYQKSLTFCSMYSCPAIIAVFPTWNPICAVGSLMNPPNPGAYVPLPPCAGAG